MRVDRLRRDVERRLAAAGQAVEAEVHRDTVKPGGEAALARTPAAGVRPEPEEDLLRDVFGVGAAAERPRGERDHPPEMPLDERAAGLTVSVADEGGA